MPPMKGATEPSLRPLRADICVDDLVKYGVQNNSLSWLVNKVTGAYHVIPGMDSEGWDCVLHDHQEAATKAMENTKHKKKTIAQSLSSPIPTREHAKVKKITRSVGEFLLSAFSSPVFVTSSERQRGFEIGLRRILKDGSVDNISG